MPAPTSARRADHPQPTGTAEERSTSAAPLDATMEAYLRALLDQRRPDRIAATRAERSSPQREDPVSLQNAIKAAWNGTEEADETALPVEQSPARTPPLTDADFEPAETPPAPANSDAAMPAPDAPAPSVPAAIRQQEIYTIRHDIRPELAILARAAAVVLMLLLVVAFARTATAAETTTPETGTISVNGKGTVTAEPDLAVISSGVVTSAPTAREAVSANTEAMRQVIARMKDLGIADRDLQTSGFSISPQYQHFRPREGQPAPPPKIVAYEVRNSLTIRIRDLEETGTILDAVVSDGANQISGIQFSIDDPTPLMQDARAKAVTDARARAEVLTQGLGIALGRVLSITEGTRPRPSPQPRMARMEMAMAADSVPVPIEAGEQSLTATVSVTWELAQ